MFEYTSCGTVEFVSAYVYSSPQRPFITVSVEKRRVFGCSCVYRTAAFFKMQVIRCIIYEEIIVIGYYNIMIFSYAFLCAVYFCCKVITYYASAAFPSVFVL